MSFLMSNQQCESNEGRKLYYSLCIPHSLFSYFLHHTACLPECVDLPIAYAKLFEDSEM